MDTINIYNLHNLSDYTVHGLVNFTKHMRTACWIFFTLKSTYGRKTTMPPFALIISWTAWEKCIWQLSRTTTEHGSPIATEPTWGSTNVSMANSKFGLSYAPIIECAAWMPLVETAARTLYRVPRVKFPFLDTLVFLRLLAYFLYKYINENNNIKKQIIKKKRKKMKLTTKKCLLL